MKPLRTIPYEAIILYRKALEHSSKGDHESSLRYLSNSVTLAPHFTIALCEMGYCYEKLGRFPEAVSKFDKVLEINNTHIEAEISRKRVLDKMGKTR
jgi:tetratricopeptide (TPR) repeat protein